MKTKLPVQEAAQACSTDGGYRGIQLLFGLVFLVALVLRVLHWWGQMRNNPFFWHPTMDEEMHHLWAQQIASGAGLGPRPFFRAPLYYGLLGGLYKLIGPNIAVARLLGCVLGSVTCYLIARLAYLLVGGSAGASPSHVGSGSAGASPSLVGHGGPTLHGVAAGVVAGLLAAVYWPLIHYDQLLLTPGVELFLNVLLLLALVRAGGVWSAQQLVGSAHPTRDVAPEFVAPASSRWIGWRWLACGVVFGLAALARPTILAFAPCVLLWIWVVGRSQAGGVLRPTRGSAATEGGAPALSRWSAIGLMFLGAVITILPVTVRNRIVGGEWVLIASYGGVNFYIGNNAQADGVAAIVPGTRPDWVGGYEDTHRIPEQELGRKLTESEVSSYWFRKGLTWIRSDPAAWLRLMFWKFRLLWTSVEIPNNQPDWFFARLSGISVFYWLSFPVVAGLGLAGLVVVARDWRIWLLPLLYLLVTLGTVLIFFCPGRYRLPAIPVLMLVAAAGLVRLPALWRVRRLKSLGAYVVVGLLTELLVMTNPPGRASHERQCDGRGHYDLGLLYSQLAETQPELRDVATEHLQAAAALRPRDIGVQVSLGVWLRKIGRTEEGGQQLAAAVAGNPDHAEAQLRYGEYLLSVGRFAEAAECSRRATVLNPAWTEPYRLLVAALTKLERVDEARAALESAARLDPNAVELRKELGVTLAEQGDFAAAAEQFAAVVARRPTDTAALLNLGSALARLEQWREAAERYRQVLRLDPQSAPALQGLVYVLKRMGTTPASVAGLDELASQFAAQGDLARAAMLVQEALNLARSAGLDDAAARLETRLAQYRRVSEGGESQ